MFDLSALFMEYFVEAIAEAIRRKRLKLGDFAAQVWPEMTARSSRQRWQYMRKEIPGKGRKLDLSLAEADKMARVLEQDLIHLFLIARESVYKIQEEAEDKMKRTGKGPKSQRKHPSDNGS